MAPALQSSPRMIALEVSSAAGHRHGGIPRAIRSLVTELVRTDPETRYDLCYRFSRRKRGGLFRPDAENVHLRWIQDPVNRVLLRGDRMLHSMGIYLPRTPRRLLKLVTVHDLNAVRNPQWVRPGWHARRSERIRETVDRADHVVTYSRFTAEEVCDQYGLPASRVHPVPLGVDLERFRPPDESVARSMRQRLGDYALAVAVVTPRKNLPRLVAAVARVPGLRLVLVGHPSDGESGLREAIVRHRMEERTLRLPPVDDETLVALMAGARVYAAPSLYEGFGLTVLEAMAVGTPTVASSAASLPEVVGEGAARPDPTSVSAIADAIERLVYDEAAAQDLRKRGLDRVQALRWTDSARRMRGLYRQLAGV